MSRVMIVAGGDWQIDLVRKVKEMGHFAVCSNLYEDSPAFQYADVSEVADVLDLKKNLEIAKKFELDAIITDQSDISVLTVAYLNEQLGLRGIGTDIAQLFTDKSKQRLFCRKHGIKIPDFAICKSSKDAKALLDRYKKIIIKPIDNQSSRGVYTITSEEELEKKYEYTLSWSNRKKLFLAEEYMEGPEFTIDGLVINGHHYPLCISVKEMYLNNPNVSRVQRYSYDSQEFDYDLLRLTNKQLIETMSLPMGLTHSEYKYYKGEFYLIEVGARGGGSNLSSRIVPFMSGIDNYEYLIKEALGDTVNENKVRNHAFVKDKYVLMNFFDFGVGIVDHIEGLDFLVNHPLIIDYQLNVEPGDKLEVPKYGRLRPGHFIIGGLDKENVEKEAMRIIDKVKVVFK